jgi:hypothetical protein
MSIEQDQQQAAVGDHLKRVGASIEELNARIARLGYRTWASTWIRPIPLNA